MDIIKIEGNKQLLIDGRFIERRDNVAFAVNPPVKAGPIDLDIQPGGMISIVKHGGQHYMYFRCEGGLCVALSEDGLRWKIVRPSAFGKGRDMPLPGVCAGSVFVDPKDSTFHFKGIFAIRGAEP